MKCIILEKATHLTNKLFKNSLAINTIILCMDADYFKPTYQLNISNFRGQINLNVDLKHQ